MKPTHSQPRMICGVTIKPGDIVDGHTVKKVSRIGEGPSYSIQFEQAPEKVVTAAEKVWVSMRIDERLKRS